VQADGLALQLADGSRLGLASAAADVATAWLEREVAVGVRPEHMLPARTGETAGFAPEIEVLEPVGNEIFVNLRHGAQSLVARCPPQALPAVGSPLPLHFAPGSLHFFDAGSGVRLTRAAELPLV
jgi:multiple sugar transport system ATP-binding protein